MQRATAVENRRLLTKTVFAAQYVVEQRMLYQITSVTTANHINSPDESSSSTASNVEILNAFSKHMSGALENCTPPQALQRFKLPSLIVTAPCGM